MDQEIIRNLKLTPQQRIEEHQKALSLVLSLDDLIKIKESMNRTKDKIVLEELKQIKQNS